MSILKGGAAERFLKWPDMMLVLLYGNDSGLVAERGARIAAAFAGSGGDVVRLDAKTLTEDPGRLVDEATSRSLFGGARAIRVSAGGLVPGIETLLETPPPNLVVFEHTGNPRPGDGLRKRFEAAREAAVIACYRDRGMDVGRVLDEELTEHGLTITPEARARLIASLGGDRGVTRSEIVKLCLYAKDLPTIEERDVEAIIDDSGQAALNMLSDCVADGEAAEADRLFRRLVAEGMDAGAILLVVMRHLGTIHRLSAEREGGMAPETAVRALRPPIFGERAEALIRQTRLWSPAAAEAAIRQIYALSLDVRRNGPQAEALAGLALVRVGSFAARRR